MTRFPSGDIEKMLREAAGPGKAELDVGYCCEQAMFLLECASADRALKPLVTLATLRQRLDTVEPDLSSRPDVAWATLLLVFESAVRLIIMMCFQRADRPRREALLKADAARGREKKNHVRLALEDLKNLWKEGQVPEILRTFLPREATAYRSLPLEEVYDWRNKGVHHGVFPDADLVTRLYYQTKAALKEIDPSRNAATDGAVKPGGAPTVVQAPAAAPKRRLWIAFAGALVVGGFSVGLVSIRQEGEVPPSHDGGHVTAPDAPDVVDSAATLDSVIVDASEGVDASDESSHEPPHPRARRAPFLLPSGRPFIR